MRLPALIALAALPALADGGRISGLVVSSGGRPLPSVEITAVGADATVRDPLSGRTGADGRFYFDDMGYDDYTLSFVKPGYEAGERVTAGAAVSDAEPEAEVRVELRKSSVIAGRVLDEDGEPVPEAQVQLLVWQTARGRRLLRPAQSAETDDRGEYRIHGLGPEKYLVRATAYTLRGVSGLMAYELESLYYPTAPAAEQAPTVALGWGQEVDGVDFRLGPSPPTAVEGFVMSADGSVCGRCQVHLLTPSGALEASVTARPDGWFGVRGLQPGEYRLSANSRRSGEAALEPIIVAERKPIQARLQLGGGAGVSGRVTVAGDADIGNITVRLRGVGVFARRQPRANANADAGGAFAMEDVAPGDYEIYVSGGGEGVYLDRILLSGQPLERPGLFIAPGAGVAGLQIRMAADGGVVEGTVDGRGRGRTDELAPPGLVALIPDAYGRAFRFELLGDYRPQDARFRIPSVPRGDYVAVTVARSNRYDLGDPEDLAYLRARGKKLTVAPGATVELTAPFLRNRE